MTLPSAIAFVRLLLAIRKLIDSTLKTFLEKQNAEDLKEIEKAVTEYHEGSDVEAKSKAAEKVRDLFRRP